MSFTEMGNRVKREGLSRVEDVFSFGPLVLRCLWDITADFEDTSAKAEEEAAIYDRSDKLKLFVLNASEGP